MMKKAWKRIGLAALFLVAGLLLLTSCGKSEMSFQGTALPSGKVGEEYHMELSAGAGPDNVTYVLKEGNLPDGLTLNPDGTIVGRPTVAGQSCQFTVMASAKRYHDAEAQFMLHVDMGEIVYGGTEAMTLEAGQAGKAYQATVAYANAAGTPVMTYQLTEGSNLPAGLTLHADGTITGTPEEGTVSHAFSVTVSADQYKSATSEFTMAIAFYAVSYEAADPGDATVGEEYSASVAYAKSEHGNPQFSYAVIPEDYAAFTAAGFQITSDGTISGIPLQAGQLVFSVIANASGYESRSAQFEISVGEGTMHYPSKSLKAAAVHAEYSASVATAKAPIRNAHISYTIVGGTMPEGLRLDSDTGDISGKPVKAGVYSFTVCASADQVRSADAVFTLEVAPELSFEDACLPTAKLDTEYSCRVIAQVLDAEDQPDVTYALSKGSKLPKGLKLDKQGNITGIATQEGSCTFSVTATVNGYGKVEAAFTIIISADDAIVHTKSALPDAAIGEDYDVSLRTAEAPDDAAVTYSLFSGELPAGLTFTNGEISGIPEKAGRFAFTVKASADGYADGMACYTLDVASLGEITFITGSYLPDVPVGSDYTVSLAAVADGAPEITYTAGRTAAETRNFTRSGFTMTENGTITGRAEDLGEVAFYVVASADNYTSAVKKYIINVTTLGTVTYTVPDDEIVLHSGELHTAYSGDSVAFATVEDASVPVTYALKESRQLPDGLTLNANGTISGTPNEMGQFTFAVVASAANYTDREAAFTITIDPLSVRMTRNYIFEAEYTNLDDIHGWGYSGETYGTGVIVMDEYEADASNGWYVGWLYYNQTALEFQLESDMAVDNATLVLRLSAEYDELFMTDDTFLIEVNGETISYADIEILDPHGPGTTKRPFSNYTITNHLKLRAGENTIRLIVNNSKKGSGGTMYASAPMVDCIMVVSDAVVTWADGYPRLDNQPSW